MANTQDLNRRIGSVTNTRKITRAMEMVAAAKLRRAQDRITTLRPFARGALELTARVAVGAGNAVNHPLLERREVKTVAHRHVHGRPRPRRRAQRQHPQALARSSRRSGRRKGADVHFVTVGRRGGGSLKFRGIEAALDARVRGHHRQPEVPRRRGDRRPRDRRLPRGRRSTTSRSSTTTSTRRSARR